MKIIIDQNGNAVGSGDGTAPLGGDLQWAEATPELLAQLEAEASAPVAIELPTVERSPLYVRRWLRARGKEPQYDALLSQLTGTAAKDYEEAVAFAWDDPVIVSLRGAAVAALGMTEAELRACFEE